MTRFDDARASLVSAPWARRAYGAAQQVAGALHYPKGTPEWGAGQLLLSSRPDLVVDVGANVGQFARGVRGIGYGGRILSFEPVNSVRERLEETARGDARWNVHGLAVGAEPGSATINVAGNRSLSSSMREMEERHSEAFPESVYIAEQDVEVVRLDAFDDAWLTQARRIFLKVDTQGFERDVLAGASGLLDRVVGLRFEVSLAALYSGEWTLLEALQWLEKEGFVVRHLVPGVVDPRTHESLQVDLVAFRPSDA